MTCGQNIYIPSLSRDSRCNHFIGHVLLLDVNSNVKVSLLSRENSKNHMTVKKEQQEQSRPAGGQIFATVGCEMCQSGVVEQQQIFFNAKEAHQSQRLSYQQLRGDWLRLQNLERGKTMQIRD